MWSPSPLPAPGLGGEEGVEDARPELGRDPGPVVHDLHLDVPPGRPRAQLDRALAAHGVDRVVDQVRPDLVELARVRLDARQIGREVAPMLTPALQLVPEDDQRVLQPLAHVDLLHGSAVEVRVALTAFTMCGDGPPTRWISSISPRTACPAATQCSTGAKASAGKTRSRSATRATSHPWATQGASDVPRPLDPALLQPIGEATLLATGRERVRVSSGARAPIPSPELAERARLVRVEAQPAQGRRPLLPVGERDPEVLGGRARSPRSGCSARARGRPRAAERASFSRSRSMVLTVPLTFSIAGRKSRTRVGWRSASSRNSAASSSNTTASLRAWVLPR